MSQQSVPWRQRLGVAVHQSTYLDLFGSWLTMFLAKASEPFLIAVMLWTAAISILPWLPSALPWMATVNGLALSVGLEGSIPGAFILALAARRAGRLVEFRWYLSVAIALFALALITLSDGVIVQRLGVTLPVVYSGGLLVFRCLLALSFVIIREVFKHEVSPVISRRDLETNLETTLKEATEKLTANLERALQSSLQTLKDANLETLQGLNIALKQEQQATLRSLRQEQEEALCTLRSDLEKGSATMFSRHLADLETAQEATLTRMEQMSTICTETIVTEVKMRLSQGLVEQPARLPALKQPPQDPENLEMQGDFKPGVQRADVAGWIAIYWAQQRRFPEIAEIRDATGCVYNTAKSHLEKFKVSQLQGSQV